MTDNKTKDNRKCGIVMPISAIDGCTESHWAEVLAIIKESLQNTEFTVELVSDSNEVGIIQKRIVQNIYDNEIVICDVSAKNPNVMFELGMRLAFDKPTIIIKDDRTDYSFDTAPIEHLTYPQDLHYHTIQSFKTKLKEKTIATYEASKKPEYTTFLKHFGQFVVATIEETQIGKDEFILQLVSDLRDDVKNLERTIRTRENEELNRRAAINLSSDLRLKTNIDQLKETLLKSREDNNSSNSNKIMSGILDVNKYLDNE